MKKTIITENGGTVTIEGTEEWIEIEFRQEDETDENSEYIAGFEFNGEWYELQGFPRIHNNPWIGQAPDWLSEYHAIMHTSAFGGILLKLDDSGDAVQVFRY